MKCVADAWAQHESELRQFLRRRAPPGSEPDDLLQEVFLRAMRQPQGLCGMANPRAWLFATARHLVIDRWRSGQTPLAEDLTLDALTQGTVDDVLMMSVLTGMGAGPDEEPLPVDALAQCLPRVLAELTDQDRDIIIQCDIQGMSQRDYAQLLGLSLPAAKSRLQRARRRLREQLVRGCQVSFDDDGQVEGFVPRDAQAI